MPPLQQYVPNIPLTVAKNLRRVDSNGYPIDSQLPNDYLQNVGSSLSTYIDVINQIADTITNQQSQITDAQTEINQILASGATAIPDVYAYCFLSSGTGLYPMDVVVDTSTNSLCNYYSSVGTASQMSLAGSQQCVNLNTSPRFAVPSAQMQSITGWKNTIQTFADSMNNAWLTICDIRGGMQMIMDQIKPSCSQVIVDYSPIISSQNGVLTMTLYFGGYTFIPGGYSDNGSTYVITDGQGNKSTASFDIMTAIDTPIVVNLPLQGLYPTSTYQVNVFVDVINTNWNVECSKNVTKIVNNNFTACPFAKMSSSISTITAALTFNIITNATYTFSLFLSSGTTAVQTQSIINPVTNTYSLTFTGLTSGTPYTLTTSVKTPNLPTSNCPPCSISTTTS